MKLKTVVIIVIAGFVGINIMAYIAKKKASGLARKIGEDL